MKNYILIVTVLLVVIKVEQAVGQNSTTISTRTINTAVPFLILTPDSRSGGLGNTGVAISPDANSIHWNNAKLAFIESEYGFSLSYTPWLAELINDMSLSYLSGYYKIDNEQAVALSLRYFNLGEIQLTNRDALPLNTIRPKEYAIDGTYSRKLSENLGIGVSARFIYSDISEDIGTADASPGTSVAADIGVYYRCV